MPLNATLIDSMGPLTPHPSALSLPFQEGTMKDGIANNSTASISQARKAVEQLKMEACMDRIKVPSVKRFLWSNIRKQILSHD